MVDFALHRKSPGTLGGHFAEKDLLAQMTDEKSTELYPPCVTFFSKKRMMASNNQVTSASKRPSINAALGTTQALIDTYSAARNKYKPRDIGVLFIAESPPSSGGYFYAKKAIGRDHLFRETMKALDLWPMGRPMRKGCDKRSMLNEFRSLGFFLIDTCEFPIDKLHPRERRISTLAGAQTLPGRVGALRPDRILIVKKTVFNPAVKALNETSFAGRILNTVPLPFPSHGNQKKYRTMLRRLVMKNLAGDN